AFPNDNRGGFEPVMPTDPAACFGAQLNPLNQRFLTELAPADVLVSLRANLAVLVNPSSDPDSVARASQALGAFVASLRAPNPGAVLQRLPIERAVRSLALPLLACPSLPPYATLQSLGCFELKPTAECASLLDTVRGCSLWGATLEQVFPNGTLACRAAGLDAKAEMESLMFAFDSNLKPVVGQQVTLGKNPSASVRARFELLVSAAQRGDADLVGFGDAGGFAYENGSFRDSDGGRLSPSALLRQLTRCAPITFTAIPPSRYTN
ncbi:MAG TPA: hypothetical protein VFQ35_07875, partial [Polyangiaceae bacterium]|nr:hypothetical protein [Polyangiaceae bacterium]